jgi:nicotinate-nucleotide adenylyltransferase
MSKKLRVGIYAGAFDPVHTGHITFALQAMAAAKLDRVVFMPERRPRSKPGVEHYGHRVAMLTAAMKPHPNLAVMEVVDRHFTVRRTLPLLQSTFQGAELVLLMGSDAVETLPFWPYAERLLRASELVIAVRSEQQRSDVESLIGEWEVAPQSLTILDSFAPYVSSSRIRQAIRENRVTDGLLRSVHRYARDQWLYVSPAYIPASS